MPSFSIVNGILWLHLVQTFEQDASLADLITGHKATLLTLLLVDGLLFIIYLDTLCGINDVNYRLWPSSFHLLDQLTNMSTICKRTVNALC